jgi:hypothetical protein
VLLACFGRVGSGRAYLPASPRHRWPLAARAPRGPAARCASDGPPGCCFVVLGKLGVDCSATVPTSIDRCAAHGDAVTGVWDQNEGRVHASRGWNDREDGVGRRGAWGARWEEALADTAPIECAPHATSLIRPRSIHSHHYSLSLSVSPHHDTVHTLKRSAAKGKEGKRSNRPGRGDQSEHIGVSVHPLYKTPCPPPLPAPSPSIPGRSSSLLGLLVVSFHQTEEEDPSYRYGLDDHHLPLSLSTDTEEEEADCVFSGVISFRRSALRRRRQDGAVARDGRAGAAGGVLPRHTVILLSSIERGIGSRTCALGSAVIVMTSCAVAYYYRLMQVCQVSSNHSMLSLGCIARFL